MIEEKIEQLFHYRKLPHLLEYFSKSDRERILPQLYALQKSIYKLDQYLETNWELNQKMINNYWQIIYDDLDKLGYKSKQGIAMCSHIQRYLLHESQLRKNLLPTRLDREYFYYYKSCDVRLIRNILFDQCRELKQFSKPSDWKYFDLVTELNDDISDVAEDLETINCNAFLIHLIQGQNVKATIESFTNSLQSLKDKSEQRLGKRNTEFLEKIHQWTVNNAILTIDLIHLKAKNGEFKIGANDSELFKNLNH